MAIMDKGRTTAAQSETEKGDAAATRNGNHPHYYSLPNEESGRIVIAPDAPEAWLANSTAPTGFQEILYLRIKRVFDLTVALLALLFLLPIFLIIALAILLEDGGPVLFSQMRVGKDGKQFRFYKFRSMVTNAEEIKAKLMAQNEAEGPIFKMKNDPRITRIGRFIRKWSLDELPQFLSVISGEMSIVGPRPHLPMEVARYNVRQQKRLSVQPGLMCLREACGRSKLSFDRWVELDLLYIETRSLWTDVRILLRTIPAILKADGAY